ncbi:hypothetical protein OIO90_004677 [Microbotryomycetes sp. JL221]|nr:hypothetical protein OIO90_004677 [Microbotryomycetes sp. JL221]
MSGAGQGGPFNEDAFRAQYPNYHAPFNFPPADNEAPIVIYGYVPSLGLAITACVIYGLCFLVHLFYFVKQRGTRWFTGLLWFGALLEIVGYAIRALSNYVVTTIVQIAGAALVGVAESSNVRGDSDGPSITSQEANRILLAGLAVQVVSFLAFLSILFLVLIKSRKLLIQRPFSNLFEWVLSITSFLVFLRTVYRLAETAEGVFGYAFTSEILFGCLDFLPVALSLIIWAVFPLHKLLPPLAVDSFKADKQRSKLGQTDVEKGSTAQQDDRFLQQQNSSSTVAGDNTAFDATVRGSKL